MPLHAYVRLNMTNRKERILLLGTKAMIHLIKNAWFKKIAVLYVFNVKKCRRCFKNIYLNEAINTTKISSHKKIQVLIILVGLFLYYM